MSLIIEASLSRIGGYWTTILHGVAYFWQIKVDLTNQVGRADATLFGWQHLIFDQPYHLHLTDTQTACGLMEDQLATFGAFSISIHRDVMVVAEHADALLRPGVALGGAHAE